MEIRGRLDVTSSFAATGQDTILQLDNGQLTKLDIISSGGGSNTTLNVYNSVVGNYALLKADSTNSEMTLLSNSQQKIDFYSGATKNLSLVSNISSAYGAMLCRQPFYFADINNTNTTILIDTPNANVGIAVNPVSSRFHIKGIGSTSANYALKVDNSSNTPMLYVRNDGVTTFGTATPYTNAKHTFDGHLSSQSISMGQVNSQLNVSTNYNWPMGGLIIGSASAASIVSNMPAHSEIPDGALITFFRSDASGGNTWTINVGSGTSGWNQFGGVFGTSITIPPASGGNTNMKKFQYSRTFSQWIQI